MLNFFEKIYIIMGKISPENLEPNLSDLSSYYQNYAYEFYGSYSDMSMLYSGYYNDFQCWYPEDNYGQLNLQFCGISAGFSTQSASASTAIQSIDSCHFDTSLLQGSNIDFVLQKVKIVVSQRDSNMFQDQEGNLKFINDSKLVNQSVEERPLFYDDKVKHDKNTYKKHIGKDDLALDSKKQDHYERFRHLKAGNRIFKPLSISSKKFTKKSGKVECKESELYNKTKTSVIQLRIQIARFKFDA